MTYSNTVFPRPESMETIDGASLLPKREPTPYLHASLIDASMLARQCQEQVAALAALAGMSRKDAMLAGEEWMSLLDPIAEQLLILRQMIEQGVDTAENRLVKVGD